MLIDSHAHINFQEYESKLDDVIKRSFANDTWIITVGSNFDSSQKAIAIAEKYKLGVWAVIGCHPIHLIKDIEEKSEFGGQESTFFITKEIFSASGGDYQKYYKLAKSSRKVVGIGETGLDFYRLVDKQNSIEQIKKIQSDTFRQFIKLAKELNLPLVLHCRGEEKKPYEAYDLMLGILNQEKYFKGVIHCFGGTLEQARKFIDLGFYIGFTGIVTFKNAKELQNIAKVMPLDKILAETDAPFLAPEPYRGIKNEPTFVRYVVQKIADLHELTYEMVEKQIFENTRNLFNI